MSTINASTSISDRPSILAKFGAFAVAFGQGLVNLLVLLSEAGPMNSELRRLNDTSDAALAARGLTRDGEVRRIFGARMGL